MATIGAGACLVLGTGHGLAFADVDGGSSSDSTGQSAHGEGQAPSRDPDAPAKRSETETVADHDSGNDTSDTRQDAPSASDRDDLDTEAVADPDDEADRDTERGARDQDRSTEKVAESHRLSKHFGNHEAKLSKKHSDNTAVDDTPATGPAAEAHVDGSELSGTPTPAVTTEAPAVAARPLGPLATAALNFLAALGWSPRPEVDETFPAPASTTVTGVRTGHSSLTIPLGANGFTTPADWYFPTQADGSVSATGVIWLQHGFLADKSFYSALAKTLSQQTNSVVVVPNVPSFSFRCSGCTLNDAAIQQAVATMFDGDQQALNTSAMKAGFQGTLPEQFILAGHSAGGGFAAGVGGFYATNPNQRRLRGVVMFDGVARDGALDRALEGLGGIPVYQIAAPPQPWNAFGAATDDLVAARPGQFVGVTLARGSHVDALIGGNPISDFFAQLVTGFSPRGNTAAVYTLANGWINDLYQGLGPADGTGIYGLPDQYIVLGDAAAVVLAPAPTVDLNRYLGTWYEVGSVKQFFSLGLVNTKAVYSLNPDGSVRVENSGNYFFDNGPVSRIVGVALPVDTTNNKLNVTFFGPASDNPPGNYWIVDLDPEYQWAIVSDPSGFSGFLLTRTPVISDELYRELLNRASVKGVRGWITRTRQPAAHSATAISV